MMKSNEMPQTS